MTTASPTKRSRPWHREPMVWLVISGPLAVVVASVLSAVVAWKHIDPVVRDPVLGAVRPGDNMADYRRPSDEQAPAQVARNHAATLKPAGD